MFFSTFVGNETFADGRRVAFLGEAHRDLLEISSGSGIRENVFFRSLVEAVASEMEIIRESYRHVPSRS